MAVAGKIPIEDISPEVLERLGIKLDKDAKLPKLIKSQLIAMGGVLLALKGLTNREALWVLRTTTVLVRGYRTDKKPNPNTTLKGRRRKIVHNRQ